MKLSASQAAKETGKSIPTITRAIKSGKLSAEKQEGGGYLIDAAELFRAFDPVSKETPVTPDVLGRETPIPDKVLEIEVKLLREQLERERELNADLSKDRDEWRRQATALLTDQRPKEPARRGWWPFGRAND